MKKVLSCIIVISAVLLVGCVDQSQGNQVTAEVQGEVQLIKDKINSDSRIVATSASLLTICDKLEIDLVAAPSSASYEIPERYEGLPVIGNSMAVDIEVLATVDADLVVSPKSLETDLKPQYEAAGIDYLFLDLTSVEGLYKAIETLAYICGKKELSDDLISEYDEIKSNSDKMEDKPTALVLMGLPGSYVVATNKSYVGNLVELAGYENVYIDDTEAFLNLSPEDMLAKKPDYIFTTAHAMPEMVYEMFEEEFKENAIWSHFDAVKNDKMYQLQHEYFGMSANFNYTNGVEILVDIMNEE